MEEHMKKRMTIDNDIKQDIRNQFIILNALKNKTYNEHFFDFHKAGDKSWFALSSRIEHKIGYWFNSDDVGRYVLYEIAEGLITAANIMKEWKCVSIDHTITDTAIEKCESFKLMLELSK